MQNPENIGQGGCVCREYFKQGRETFLPESLSAIAIGAVGDAHGAEASSV